ncbi:MAG: 30S ribosomal protein S6 [Pseudobdellovibrionaceae bacterium]
MSLRTQELKRPYEVVVLMHPDTTLDEQKELFRKNKSIIEQFKGSVHSLETWGKRTLGTPIGKMRKAHYFHSTFEARPDAIAELERTMRINDRVIRFCHTRLDERVTLTKFMEDFKRGLKESADRDREREAKIQARKAAMASARASEQ